MKTRCFLLITCILLTEAINGESIPKFGVKPSNSPEENKLNLQKVIDTMTICGGNLYIDPSDVPYRITGGIILKKNVSLTGANAATPRGTCHPSKPQPAGSVFEITDCFGYPLGGIFIRFDYCYNIAQGAIIANTGESVQHVHPIVTEGKGHTSISDVEAFSEHNGALTTPGASFDFLKVTGTDKCTISLSGCRMRNYLADDPLTINNKNAIIQAVGCIDKNEKIFSK